MLSRLVLGKGKRRECGIYVLELEDLYKNLL